MQKITGDCRWISAVCMDALFMFSYLVSSCLPVLNLTLESGSYAPIHYAYPDAQKFVE